MINIFQKFNNPIAQQLKEPINPVISSVFGLAVADALGVPHEFKSRTELHNRPVLDMYEYGTHNQPKGTWSDDTSLTLAAMDSIIECNRIDYNDIMKKFIEWQDNSKYTATGTFFDIGVATTKALNKFKKGIPPLECGGKGERDNGNGSLMRILPFVLYLHNKNLSYEEETKIINDASSLTHAHEISCLGCRIYADYINALLNGKDKLEALEYLNTINYNKYYREESIKYYERILNGSIKKEYEKHIQSSGFVVSTLEASLWCILNTNNYKQAVLKAVNLGDDTDTVGTVTGSIAGIIYSYNDIPKNWRIVLKNNQYLLELCNKFIKTIENKKED